MDTFVIKDKDPVTELVSNPGMLDQQATWLKLNFKWRLIQK